MNYRFNLDRPESLDEAETTLHLALYAVEGLFGQARTSLEVRYALDAPDHALVVDGSTEVGRAVAQVFTGLLIRQFGEAAFTVRRVGASQAVTAAPSPAEVHGT